MWVSAIISNRGDGGDVYAQLQIQGYVSHSLVFHMDGEETVEFGAYFQGSSGLGITKFYFMTRAAQTSDQSIGVTRVVR